MLRESVDRRAPGSIAFKLSNVTRGTRWLNWLSGHFTHTWIDRAAGRIAMRIARLCGKSPLVAWPGPFWSQGAVGTPMLSWFVAPVKNASDDALAASIESALAYYKDAGTSPEVKRLMQRVATCGLSGKRSPEAACPPELLETKHTTRVLLIDERTRSNGLAAATRHNAVAAFARMLHAARAAHPDAEFWIAPSDDTGSGRWLSSQCSTKLAGARPLADAVLLRVALPHVDRVYTLGASEGLHALLAGVPVHVYGAPWYAGWGLTHDEAGMPARTGRPSLAALFDVVFLRFARYLNPVTHTPGTLADVLDCIELQRTVQRRFADLHHAVGVRFQWWKRPFATPYISAGGGTLRWTNNLKAVTRGESAVLWGARSDEGLAPTVPRIRIEDGFFHSSGLGSDMVAPCSQVIDRRGLYFDATHPSDLSVLLNETDFPEAELRRAAALRKRVVDLGVTKYNLGRRRPQWTAPTGRQIVLVPGQVADDASIRLGTKSIGTADALLREVRRLRRDAFVVYKPHPDVLSGNRNGLIDAQQLADVVDTEADLLSLIDIADEVHTLSSLAGFDALLRCKAVFTYGLPFYAGWGLTHDSLAPVPWRCRTLTLDMLCAGVLLHYPLYWDWRTSLFTTPEAVVDQLAPQAARPLKRVHSDRVRPFRKAFRWTRNGVSHALWRLR
ncbi:capsular polysaccharide biosynthesis protein [Paraburkholderia sediminicola]|uniref:capsular polysaccharide biosynthesis protein n=1 Tax=Paraburkholderia sediminicola TaxID=458836 RepID=UPI0038B98544